MDWGIGAGRAAVVPGPKNCVYRLGEFDGLKALLNAPAKGNSIEVDGKQGRIYLSNGREFTFQLVEVRPFLLTRAREPSGPAAMAGAS